jgi:NAD(P)H-hydrate repair Nnr-like enzyme with NAD(P)H-hydrate dehydratase domain
MKDGLRFTVPGLSDRELRFYAHKGDYVLSVQSLRGGARRYHGAIDLTAEAARELGAALLKELK